MRQCRVDLVPMDHPGDASAIAGLFDRGAVDPADVVAILGKTEGNGCVNDFTRGYAVTVLKALLAGRLGCSPEEAGNRVSMIMSGGTEGRLHPRPAAGGDRDAGPGHGDGRGGEGGDGESRPGGSRSGAFRPDQMPAA